MALTSGGGSPPAPAGQSGSILFLPSQVQEQAGDGCSMVQFLELNSCLTASGTGGVLQSSSPMVQGASLTGATDRHVRSQEEAEP